jgi:hypothetical protein
VPDAKAGAKIVRIDNLQVNKTKGKGADLEEGAAAILYSC